MTMHLDRIQDLSMFYYVKDVFLGYPSITIKDGFPLGEDLVLPSISVESDQIYIRPRELGNRIGKRLRLWIVDIYGDTKAQRDTMLSTLLDSLETVPITVYDYNEGFPPVVSPSQLGSLIIGTGSITATPTRVFPELIEKLYWRVTVRFVTDYQPFI